MQKLVKTKTVSETVTTRWAALEEREGDHACLHVQNYEATNFHAMGGRHEQHQMQTCM